MTLQEQATADLAAMINDREFAVDLSIDGEAAVACILDEELAEFNAEGVREWDATLYVRAADLQPTPVINQRMEIGAYADAAGNDVSARSAVVAHVGGQHGLRVIRLRWYES